MTKSQWQWTKSTDIRTSGFSNLVAASGASTRHVSAPPRIDISSRRSYAKPEELHSPDKSLSGKPEGRILTQAAVRFAIVYWLWYYQLSVSSLPSMVHWKPTARRSCIKAYFYYWYSASSKPQVHRDARLCMMHIPKNCCEYLWCRCSQLCLYREIW